MKKMIGISLVMLAILGVCANVFAAGGTEQTGEKAQQVVLNMTFWNESQKPIMQAISSAFEKENPNIKVELTVTPFAQYWTNLQTSLPTGTGADIFWLNAYNAGVYIPAGLVLNLQPYMKKDGVDLKDFPESLKKLYRYNGDMYAIPKDYDTIGLFYNKAMFDKAGVAYPNGDWTWNDVLEAAKKLTITGADGKIQQYGYIATPNAQMSTLNYILQNGGAVFSDDGTRPVIDSAGNVEAIQFLVDMMYTHKVSPTGADLQEVNGNQMFTSKMGAMIAHGSWMATPFFQALGADVAVAPLPMKARRATVIHGLGLAGSAKTKYPDEVWKFLKFASTKGAQELQSSMVIPAVGGSETLWVSQQTGVNRKVFIDALSYSYPLPVSAKSPLAASQIFDDEIANIWMKKKTPAEGLRDAQKRMLEAMK